MIEPLTTEEEIEFEKLQASTKDLKHKIAVGKEYVRKTTEIYDGQHARFKILRNKKHLHQDYIMAQKINPMPEGFTPPED